MSATAALESYRSVEEAVWALQPAKPLYCMHPDRIHEAARLFLDHFPGKTFYAIKANPDEYVLRQLGQAGIHRFDVASEVEIQIINTMYPHAELAFMNTVKAREAIAMSYFDYDVRTYVCDSFEELRKIRQETGDAQDLTLFVRLGLPEGSALHPLSGKFGASPERTSELLADVARTAERVGLSFHVGSQTMNPASYADALKVADQVIRASGVKLDILDVGGGFPVPSSRDEAPPLLRYFETVRNEVTRIRLPETCELWAEPGTALCGRSTTLVLRVELRKDKALHLNDGGYGALFDCCWLNAHRDMRAIYADPERHGSTAQLEPFKLYGPTCDSADALSSLVPLPADIDEGDYVVISDIGAYGKVMQNGFNGFYSDQKVEISATANRRVIPLPPHRGHRNGPNQ